MPGEASTSFQTLEREHAFRQPNKSGPAVPSLEELVAPHIESFDALFDDTYGPSLIQLAIDDMTPRVLFDGSGGAQNLTNGNKLESEHLIALLRPQTHIELLQLRSCP
jgi:DNA-directed RNA polymerase I subunit RPA2